MVLFQNASWSLSRPEMAKGAGTRPRAAAKYSLTISVDGPSELLHSRITTRIRCLSSKVRDPLITQIDRRQLSAKGPQSLNLFSGDARHSIKGLQSLPSICFRPAAVKRQALQPSVSK
jgi:hypothetical protein